MQAICCLHFHSGSSTSVRVATISSAPFKMFTICCSNICATKTQKTLSKSWGITAATNYWYQCGVIIIYLLIICCFVLLFLTRKYRITIICHYDTTCLVCVMKLACLRHSSFTTLWDLANPTCCSTGDDKYETQVRRELTPNTSPESVRLWTHLGFARTAEWSQAFRSGPPATLFPSLFPAVEKLRKIRFFFLLRIRIINDRKLQSQWVYQSLSFQFVDFVVQLPPFLFHSWDVATLRTTTTKMFPSLFWYFWHAVVILTKQTKCERRI